MHIVGDPQYHQLQDWAIHLVRDLPQDVQLVKYNNSDKAKVHVLGEMVRTDSLFGDYTTEQQQMIIQNGTCPVEPNEIFQHCISVYLVKMTNFEVDPQALGDAVQEGINFVHQQQDSQKQASLEASLPAA